MNIRVESYFLPASWACAFMYGDLDGLTDEETHAIESLDLGNCASVEGDGDDFRRYHDASHVYPYAANVAEFIFYA